MSAAPEARIYFPRRTCLQTCTLLASRDVRNHAEPAIEAARSAGRRRLVRRCGDAAGAKRGGGEAPPEGIRASGAAGLRRGGYVACPLARGSEGIVARA
jgi:hypothetical protein